jgi:threonine aldolase
MIDLRSDTVTRPGPGMREAMRAAVVGDDVYGEDPTVAELELQLATMFGHEAGLFCPSGTMTNQIAIAVHTRPGDEVICDEGAHIYRYEGGGIMANSGCSVRLVQGDRGRFTATDVEACHNDPGDPHGARTRLVSVENTCNRGGGSTWSLEEVRGIRRATSALGLGLHMDGARIFNALVAGNERPDQWGPELDSISICLSKGLGAPVGSVLIGNASFIKEARRIRKRLGGGMRQAGVLAAAGLYALDHHIQRLAMDHARASRIAAALGALPGVRSMLPVATNIIIFEPVRAAKGLVEELRANGVLAHVIGHGSVRFVLHLDIDDKDTVQVIDVLERLLQ